MNILEKKYLFQNRASLFAIVVLLGIAALVQAKNLFHDSNTNEASLSAEKVKMLTANKKDKTIKSLRRVIADTSALSGNTLDIDLGNGNILSIKKNQTDTDPGIWKGQSETNPLDQATLIVDKGLITGSINYKGTAYLMEPLGNDGEHIIVQRDVRNLKD